MDACCLTGIHSDNNGSKNKWIIIQIVTDTTYLAARMSFKIGEALHIYKLIWSLLSSRFLLVTWFLRQNSSFLWWYLPSVLFFCGRIVSFFHNNHPCTSLQRLPLSFYCLSVAHVLRDQEREGNTRSDRKRKSFVRVWAKLLWRPIYCSNTRPKPNSQYGSMSRRGLGMPYTLAMGIIYNKCWCYLSSDYIRRILLSDIYPLLWPFIYFVGSGGKYYVLLLARSVTSRRWTYYWPPPPTM